MGLFNIQILSKLYRNGCKNILFVQGLNVDIFECLHLWTFCAFENYACILDCLSKDRVETKTREDQDKSKT